MMGGGGGAWCMTIGAGGDVCMTYPGGRLGAEVLKLEGSAE